MKKTLYANGKLFLMGEYTVLDGSRAFAVPTKFGQSMDIEPNDDNVLRWASHDADGSIWLEASFSIEDIKWNRRESNPGPNTMLLKVLHAAHTANPEILSSGFDVTTKLTFPRNWGLGTSSTFIAMVAAWFGIDAYALLAATFGGSGYDIACAQHDTPIIYTLENGQPEVTPVDFYPAFADKLYFVYLNQKQNSRDAIMAYRERAFDKNDLVIRINRLIDELVYAPDLNSFSSALEKQEALLGGVLGIAPVQERLFPDFKGVVKSLGAWGGDFVLAVAEDNPIEYFTAKGFETIVPYSEMVL
ncbi:GYDIA family GHMP kinase [Flavobacterium psychrotrophum]|uniref:GYDIA family GHMP kinase n=1 Tax=Flavobacterium psychrotrophum TaxID=2294119 RepID=UPI000E30B797|nr:GYDIA family GHMP kinase [Flavobacterium psychrotrophum]